MPGGYSLPLLAGRLRRWRAREEERTRFGAAAPIAVN
jgi:hypothetical protein